MKTIRKEIAGKTYLYNKYKRKKPNGGFREITAPDPELKLIQKTFAENFYKITESKFSDEITGFRPGMSIKDNAKVHLNKDWVINLDIKSFFPSTRNSLVEWALRSNKIENFENFNFLQLVELLTLDGGLPQGSPASPVLANYIAIYFVDPIIKREINNILGYVDYQYTRYADDVTFSFNSKEIKRETIKTLVTRICEALEGETAYQIARNKIHVRHKSQRQHVTGIIVNEGFSIKREDRNRLRAMMHKFHLGEREMDSELSGKLNFVRDVDPELYEKLTKGVKKCA